MGILESFSSSNIANFNLDFTKCFSKILLKPDDQLELDEAALKLEHTRILSARNPHAPDNLITFDFNAMNFTPGPAIEHMETNYKRMVSYDLNLTFRS